MGWLGLPVLGGLRPGGIAPKGLAPKNLGEDEGCLRVPGGKGGLQARESHPLLFEPYASAVDVSGEVLIEGLF